MTLCLEKPEILNTGRTQVVNMSTHQIISNPSIPFLNSFLNAIKRNETIAVLYDDDADGLCAAAVFVQMMQRFGILDLVLLSKSEENDLFGKEFYQKLLARNIKTIFCLDFDPLSWDFLTPKGLETLPFNLIVIDHHTDNTRVYEKSISMHMRMFIHPLNVTNCTNPGQYCTSKLVFDAMSTLKDLRDIEWKILPGMIGDMNIIGWPDYIVRVAAKNDVRIDTSKPEGFFTSPFGQFALRAHMLNAKDYREFENALQVLVMAGSISEANSKLVVDPEIERIYNDLLTNYRTMAVVDSASGLSLIELHAQYQMASFVSSTISYLHPQETFLLYENAHDGFYNLSIRSQHPRCHLGQLLDTVSRQFEGANGGGHEPAAGARCKEADIAAFIEKIKAGLIGASTQ